ncbi:hypothetical protein GTB64_004422 [Salmonella enterica]|nr:hypothetical protein [Salmonella enterica]
MPLEHSSDQAAPAIPADYLPSIPEVVAVLKMCVDHDIPLEKLPRLWDEHQQLIQIERRAGIQNGNMTRELERLRQLTAELDKQIRDSAIELGDRDDEIKRLEAIERHLGAQADKDLACIQQLETRIAALEGNPDQLALYRQRIHDMTETESRLESRIVCMEQDKREQDDAMQEQSDRYAALLARCKHFEALADHRKADALDDLVCHYREGMNGLKQIAKNPHFSYELRVDLMRRVLYVFEPELVITGHMGTTEGTTDA